MVKSVSIAVLSVSVTMALTPLLAKVADYWGRKADQVEAKPSRFDPSTEKTPEPVELVGGFGRCSEAVGAFLREHHILLRPSIRLKMTLKL